MTEKEWNGQPNTDSNATPCEEPREGLSWARQTCDTSQSQQQDDAPQSCEPSQPPEEDHFPTYEEFRDIVADLLDELPEAFFTDLSGGVLVEESLERAPQAVADDLYHLGVYRVSSLGRQIAIFYGSFAHAFSYLRGEALKQQVRETVRHEFRHHLEFLAGIHNSSSLEAEDERQIRAYLERHNR